MVNSKALLIIFASLYSEGTSMRGNREAHCHCLNDKIPVEIAEKLKELFPENADRSVEEVLAEQESAYHYIQTNGKKKDNTSTSREARNINQPSGGAIVESQLALDEALARALELDDNFELFSVSNEKESAYHYIQTNGKKKDNTSTSSQARNIDQPSGGAIVESQLALDEALARALELDDNFDDLCVTGHNHAVAESVASNPREMPSTVTRHNPRQDDIDPDNVTNEVTRHNPRQDDIDPDNMTYEVTRHNPRQDDIDPDNMTYEELQTLGDAVGHESKGLSDDLIRRLPTYKYKKGFFFKKKKKEDCVICCSEYKGGTRLTTLPCAHQYHTDCINRWLKDNKNCPVCQVEVRGD